MASIVLGLATSHSPMLVLKVEEWAARVAEEMKSTNRSLYTLEGRPISYDELKAQRGEPYKHFCNLETFQAWANEAQQHSDHLAGELRRAAPDVVLVIGDDQRELYGPENTPAVAMYYGDQITMHPIDLATRPAWTAPVWTGYGMDQARTFPAAPDLARQLIVKLMDQDIDIAACGAVPDAKSRGFGHAFGYVATRLFGEKPVPMLPLLLNTYSPPNVPSAARAYEIGRKLRLAIEQCDSPARIAVMASGGLSHFICEEEHDRKVLRALERKDSALLSAVPRGALISGSSEILNWIAAGGALEMLDVAWSRYIPIRRSPAGTGIGLGFMVWHPV